MSSVFYNATSVATIPTRWVQPTEAELIAGWSPPNGFIITGVWYRGTDINVTIEVREIDPNSVEANRFISRVPVTRETITPILGEWVRYDEAEGLNTCFVGLARG